MMLILNPLSTVPRAMQPAATNHDSTLVLIRHGVVGFLDEMVRRDVGSPEVGGILIGKHRDPHLEVVAYTGPGPKDISKTYEFVRQDGSHQKAAADAWLKSDETETFVGEWHSHPFGSIVPSGIDRHTWRRLCRRGSHRMAFVLVTPEGWGVFTTPPGWRNFRLSTLIVLEEGLLGRVFGLPGDSSPAIHVCSA
jgi:integrative and conjugative element protein (TIGR02256 family)